jgi:uncharacterized membrane protein
LSRPSVLGERDLVAVAALSVVGLLVTVIPFPDWFRAIVLMPLVIVLPGYALAAAIFPPGFVTREERTVFTIAFSIGAAALGGLLLQLVVRLDRGTWLGLLLVVTLAACAVALSRRNGQFTATWKMPPIDPVPVAAIVVAVAIGGAALAIASNSASRQLDRSHFSALWIVPKGINSGRSANQLEIGVQNHEGRSLRYRLRISHHSATVRKWKFRLGSGQLWQTSLPAGSAFGNGPVVATLFRNDVIYRRVAIDTGASF